MKIYDCFQFFDEEMLLDLRLNVMDRYIDKFIITEAAYTHNGKPKKLIFDINNFSKFKDKIIYIAIDEQPPDLYKIYDSDNDEKDTRGQKIVLNGYKRDNYQRQKASEALKNLDPEDWVLISDIDEIPNLDKINLKEINNKIILFKQKIFYYKFNLLYQSVSWFGSKGCKKKNLLSPQWLRNIRQKKYPLWRIDTLFSKKKYIDVRIIKNGGWHFTNIKSPEDIEKKFLNYVHHYEFESSGLKINDIKKIVKEKKVLYDLSQDQREYKWAAKTSLTKVDLSEMPDYLKNNSKKYNNWLDV